MTAILQWVIAGLCVGLVYALFGVGFSLMFGVMRSINIAHAGSFVLAALAACRLSQIPAPDWAQWLIVIGGSIATGILSSVFVYFLSLYFLLRRGTNRVDIEIASFLSTLGAFFILQSVAVEWTDARPLTFNFALGKMGAIDLGGVTLPLKYLVMVAAAIICLGITEAILATKIGRFMRAIADNRMLASVMGIEVRRTQAIAMVLAGGIAGVGGMMIAYLYGQATFGEAHSYLFKALVIGIIAGFGSMRGAAIVALGVGLIEAGTVQYFGSAYRDFSFFVLIIVALAFRPEGIFVRAQRLST